jgi:hypothetical protein
MHPFRMYGRIIELNRYSVTYQEQLPALPEEETEQEPIERTEYVPTKEEADSIAARTGGTVTALETGEYEWLDGIEVSDVPDTFAEAIKIYEMGQTAYQELLNTPTPEEDTMAMMIDHEYRLTILEVM